jgi:hypothetical protein
LDQFLFDLLLKIGCHGVRTLPQRACAGHAREAAPSPHS